VKSTRRARESTSALKTSKLVPRPWATRRSRLSRRPRADGSNTSRRSSFGLRFFWGRVRPYPYSQTSIIFGCVVLTCEIISPRDLYHFDQHAFDASRQRRNVDPRVPIVFQLRSAELDLHVVHDLQIRIQALGAPMRV
jgi:hypothetical protein